MAIILKRTIYTQSDVRVAPMKTLGALGTLGAATFTPAVAGGPGPKGWNHIFACGATNCNEVANVNTVQNATMTLNIPRADVNVFGVEGVIARPQLEAETATLEFSWIPETSSSVAQTETLSDTDLNALIKDTISANPDFAGVASAGVGEITNALMNSLTGEASVGALPTFTASFTGATFDATNPAHYTPDKDGDALGEHLIDAVTPAFADAPVAVGDLAVGNAVPDVVTPKDINLYTVPAGALGSLLDTPLEPDAGDPGADANAIQESCAQSASFSWDVPVETILCLGGDPATDGIALGNPPGTASFTIEALMTQLVGQGKASFDMTIGLYKMRLHNGEVDSRTHNLAVGDLYGSYNYVIGGTGDGFSLGDI